LREERKQLVASAIGAAKDNATRAVELAERRTVAMEHGMRNNSEVLERLMMLAMMRMLGSATFQAVGGMSALGFPADLAALVPGPAAPAPAAAPANIAPPQA